MAERININLNLCLLRFFTSIFLIITLESCSLNNSTAGVTANVKTTLSTPSIPTDTPKPNKATAIEAIVTQRAHSKATQDAKYTSTAKIQATIHALTPSSTPAPTRTPSPTIAFPPYQTKKVILKYYGYYGLGSPDYLFDVFLGERPGTTHIVLYSDGQIILQKFPDPILTKTLSQGEMDQLFSQLDKRGFYSIETNQKHDDTDPLYNFEGRYLEVGGTDQPSSCLSVSIPNSRELCYDLPYSDFLVPQAKALFTFIENYAPNNMTLYQPDRILLFVSKGQGAYNSFNSEPAISTPWSSDLPSLETREEKYIYVDGEEAKKVFSFWNRSSNPRMFSENGQDYSVFIDLIYPHEIISQP